MQYLKKNTACSELVLGVPKGYQWRPWCVARVVTACHQSCPSESLVIQNNKGT